MKLRKLLHPFHYQLLRMLFSRNNRAVEKEARGKRRIFVLQAADYGNAGDIAITIAQCERLSRLFPDRKLVVMNASTEYDDLKTLLTNIKHDDIITIVGGGSVGDVYYYYEIYRQLVVALSRRTPVVIFPQSIKFRKISNFRRAANIYGRKRHLLFCAREEHSFQLLRQFGVRRILVPDIVFALDRFYDGQRSGAGLCLRVDREAKLTANDRAMLHSVTSGYFDMIASFDTHCSLDNLSPSQRSELFERMLIKISTKRLLVTDRLHGMIFGFITGTPTIALSNNNPKIRESYKWISDCRYVLFIDNPSEFEDALRKLTNTMPHYDEFIRCRGRLLERFARLDQALMEIATTPRTYFS